MAKAKITVINGAYPFWTIYWIDLDYLWWLWMI